MKRVLSAILIVAAILAAVSCATPVPASERIYQTVVDARGTQKQLYTATLEWMAKAFRSSKSVIQFQDPEFAKIIGKGTVDVTYTISPVPTNFTLTVETKDGRARFTFDQMYVEYTSGLLAGSKMALENSAQMDKFNEKAAEMVAEWKDYVSSGSSDW